MFRLLISLIFILFISCGYSVGNKNVANKSSDEPTIITSENPIDIGLNFINAYVENCNKMKESVEVVEWVNSNKLTTHHFRTELVRIMKEAYKVEPEIGLGADPIFDAQDYPDQGFELDHFDSTTNYLVVKGKDWPTFKLTIRMVYEKTNWLVDGCGIINIPDDKRAVR